MNNNTIIPHPASANAQKDRLHERENLARQLRSTQMAREQAREQINPTDIISRILEIQTKLLGEFDAAGNPIPLDPALTKQYIAVSNIDFKLLNKVVPDLKATESISYSQNDHNHNHQHKQVDDLELIARLRLFNKTHKSALTIVPEDDSDEPIDITPTPTKVFDFL